MKGIPEKLMYAFGAIVLALTAYAIICMAF